LFQRTNSLFKSVNAAKQSPEQWFFVIVVRAWRRRLCDAKSKCGADRLMIGGLFRVREWPRSQFVTLAFEDRRTAGPAHSFVAVADEDVIDSAAQRLGETGDIVDRFQFEPRFLQDLDDWPTVERVEIAYGDDRQRLRFHPRCQCFSLLFVCIGISARQMVDHEDKLLFALLAAEMCRERRPQAAAFVESEKLEQFVAIDQL